MAQYKVPQDVEADDKLLGPFSPRQVLYLFIAAILIFLIVSSFSLSSILGAILLVLLTPPAIFLLIIALPLRKDQPTEVYVIALIDFYFRKPHNRFWIPGQRETTIKITAPKIVDDKTRVRNISTDEASRRLSFLSDIIDSEGRSIRGDWSPVKSEYLSEAATAPDMFESYSSELLDRQIMAEAASSRDEIIKKMRLNLEKNDNLETQNLPKLNTEVIQPKPEEQNPAKQAALEALSKNDNFSVATIAKEADRIEHKKDGEIYISLH